MHAVEAIADTSREDPEKEVDAARGHLLELCRHAPRGTLEAALAAAVAGYLLLVQLLVRSCRGPPPPPQMRAVRRRVH